MRFLDFARNDIKVARGDNGMTGKSNLKFNLSYE